jgi:hypothetical protein
MAFLFDHHSQALLCIFPCNKRYATVKQMWEIPLMQELSLVHVEATFE